MRPDDSGVSPVVGMVLVLAISVLGITGVLMWGLPAINEMKASVEHQSVATEFHELIADIQELAKATASKTAKLWRFSQAQGDFTVQAQTERWVVMEDGSSSKTSYRLTAYGLDDADAKFTLVNQNALPPGQPAAGLKVNLKADFLDGAATIPLYWFDPVAGACPASITATPLTQADLPWASAGVGGPKTLCLYQGTQTAGTYSAISLRDRMLQVQLTNSTTPTETVAWLWATDVGRAQWLLNTAGGSRSVYASNGVVLQGTNGGLAVDGDPSVTPPAKQGGTFRFFARLITLNGTASLGGQARIDVLLNLYGTRALADEVAGNATKIWTYGTLESTWDEYFLEHGYAMTEKTETETSAPAGTKYLEYRPVDTNGKDVGMKLILHHSVITAKG